MLLTQNIRMGKKCDLSDFDLGMIVGARQGGLSILHKSLKSLQRMVRKQKTSSEGKNILLMKEVRGE